MLEHLQSLPLNGFRVFDAAARLGSFAAAASELNVTPAAVSQQIKKIEDQLGVSLFERTGGSIRLTEAGRGLQSGVADALTGLNNAVGQAKFQPASNHISISTVGAFAARWLVPRLDRWRALYPEIDIRVSTGGQLIDFKQDDIDLGIRIGGGHYPGLFSELLLAEAIVPLCHPSLLDRDPPLNGPEDLAHHTLIHFDPVVGDINTHWGDWLAAAGVQGVDHRRGLFFNDYFVAINAAMTGQGVLLAPRTLVEIDLRGGVLVVPFESARPQRLGWHMVMPHQNLARPNIASFRNWILSEAAAPD
ncbi:MAG: transcriptional regulator GcvA [Proteobacteria bacterium]|nr:transcriptional regulator GcvA [Pseudomonadota bacterium]